MAVCFFGEMGFIDRFMIQNFIRCVIAPFRKYIRDDVEFYYFMHTFIRDDVFTYIEIMRAPFPFSSITLHDQHIALYDNHRKIDASVFLQDYSLHRVKKKWKNIDNLDIVIYTRLDLLLTKPLTENDVSLIVSQKQHLFVGGSGCDLFAVGSPAVMNVYADRLHYLGDTSFLDLMRSQHNIKIHKLSLVFVRILPDAIVLPEDNNVCPYLSDLISSSSTIIRMTKRKNSLK
jgi:hypothetical protein